MLLIASLRDSAYRLHMSRPLPATKSDCFVRQVGGLGWGNVVFVWTNAASAEVLDKLEFPWEPTHWIAPVMALVLATALATSKQMPVRLGGLIIAIMWAATSLWGDPWFDGDVGNALRAELTAEQSSKWFGTILAQALIPLGVTVAVFLGRTWQSKLESQPSR